MSNGSTWNETDHGVWEPKNNGRLDLHSYQRFRSIEAGPYTIEIHSQEELNQLPLVYKQIGSLLQDQKKRWFIRQTLNKIKFQIKKESGFTFRAAISSSEVFKNELIRRFELENLFERLRDSLNQDPRLFRVNLNTYKGYEFLVWKETEMAWNRNQDQIESLIDEFEKAKSQPTLPGKPLPPLIFVRISQADFEKIFHDTGKPAPIAVFD